MRASFFTLITAAFLALFSIESRSQEATKVQIDFDTRSDDNKIELGKTSIVSVAIITTPEFNAYKVVDDEHLLLNGVMVEKGGWGSGDHPKCSDSDVNGDDVFDLVCKFDVRKLGLSPGQQEVILTGKSLADGVAFEGRDSVDVR